MYKEVTKQVVTKELYEKWKLDYSQFAHFDYTKFKRYWATFCKMMAEEVRDNPFGLELPYNMGLCKVIVFDIEFKCEKDFNTVRNSVKGTTRRIITPVAEFNEPKRSKIMWKKSRNHMRIMRWWGCEYTPGYKNIIGKGVKENIHKYFKIGKRGGIPSKCEDIQEKPLFD